GCGSEFGSGRRALHPSDQQPAERGALREDDALHPTHEALPHDSRRVPATGIVIAKTAPPSGRLAAVMLPPCASTTPRAIVRPRPVPPWLGCRPCQKSANRFGRSSDATPGPSSATV